MTLTVMTGAFIQFAIAMTGAVVFFVLARLLVAGLHRFVGPTLGWVRPGLSQMDRFLVLQVSTWIGLSDTIHWRRWLRLVGLLILAAAMGAFLPAALAVPGLVAGLVAVVAVFRRWAWDEEDRALGLGPDEKRAKGVEDFNDEVLAALAAVFMLSSLLVWRLTGLHAFTQSADGGVDPYLTYMLSEALEALPIVGNVEVLGYDNPSGVKAVLPSGGWIAFGLRMALDLVVIGGLLKAIDIAGRIARGQDLRREDEAIRTGEPARVMQAVDTLTRLALGEDLNAVERLKDLARDPQGNHADARFRLMALDALDTIASHRPLLASDLYNFTHGAANDLFLDPCLEERGYLPAAHLQMFYALQAVYERSHGETARNLLNASAVALAHAITKPGFSPFADVLRSDTPQAITEHQRAELGLRYAEIQLRMGTLVGGEGAAAYLNGGIRMVEAALRTLDEQDTPADWSRAWLIMGQLLTRLGQYDPSSEGDAHLMEAEAAFANSARVRSRDQTTEDWFALRMCQGVREMEVARRLTGTAALENLQRAADLLLEATNGLGTLGTEPGWVSRGLLNHGAVLLDAVHIHATGEAPDVETILYLADEAAQSYTQAMVAVDGLGLMVEYLEGAGGLALAYRALAEWGDDPEAWLMVAATRRLILERTDEARDPVAWAFAALEASHAEHEVGRRGVSDTMTRTALDLLTRARVIFERYQLSDALAQADDLERSMRVTLVQFAAEQGNGPPEGETIH